MERGAFRQAAGNATVATEKLDFVDTSTRPIQRAVESVERIPIVVFSFISTTTCMSMLLGACGSKNDAFHIYDLVTKCKERLASHYVFLQCPSANIPVRKGKPGACEPQHHQCLMLTPGDFCRCIVDRILHICV